MSESVSRKEAMSSATVATIEANKIATSMTLNSKNKFNFIGTRSEIADFVDLSILCRRVLVNATLETLLSPIVNLLPAMYPIARKRLPIAKNSIMLPASFLGYATTVPQLFEVG
jgi:hypothetical protein